MFQESPKFAAFHSAIGCDLYNGNGRRGDVVTWLIYIYLLGETRNSRLENLIARAIPFGAGGRGPGFPLSFIGNIEKKTEVKEPPSLLLHIHGNLKVTALGIFRKYGFLREAMAFFLLLLDSPADLDILCCGSFSRKLKFNLQLFMHEIFNHIVCVK